MAADQGRYTGTAMVLHWLVAALITVNVALIWSVDLLPEDTIRPVIDTHKSIGITVLGLVLLRILWRIAHPPPPLPADYPRWERAGAHAAHLALYLVILALPISGWMHDSAWTQAATHPMFLYGVVPWPRIWPLTVLDPALKDRLHDVFGFAHASFAYILYGLFALHVLGALKHQFVDREPELERMVPWGTDPASHATPEAAARTSP